MTPAELAEGRRLLADEQSTKPNSLAWLEDKAILEAWLWEHREALINSDPEAIRREAVREFADELTKYCDEEATAEGQLARVFGSMGAGPAHFGASKAFSKSMLKVRELARDRGVTLGVAGRGLATNSKRRRITNP